MSGGARDIGALLDKSAARLAAAGVESSRLDARVLLAHVLGVASGAVPMLRDRSLDDGQHRHFEELLARRASREPVAYLVGAREFWSLSFAVDRHTLIPRPDSETLVAAALALHADRDARLRVLDLGTGSGCLLLAILSERPNAWGVGVDRDPAAVRLAQRNAAALGLAQHACFLAGDWSTPLNGPFDLIVSNPPYIRSGDIADLAQDVRAFEPRAALDGGPDGLAAYRALSASLARLLAPSGAVMVETGAGQAIEIEGIFRDHGWRLTAVHNDLAGHARCLAFARARQIQPSRKSP